MHYCFPKCINRKLDQKWNIWDSNQCLGRVVANSDFTHCSSNTSLLIIFFCLYGHINSTQTQWAIIHHYVHYFKLWVTLYLASRGLIKFLRLWHQSTVHWDALFIGCSSLVLYCPFSTCGISDFSKNLWFLLAWNSIGKLSTMYTCC